MQYSTTEGAQGICPAGSHIPSDNDWKILEMQLGMSQEEADKSYIYRGTDQGAQLKLGGVSGFNMPLAGGRGDAGGFGSMGYLADLWSSTKSGSSVWSRRLLSSSNSVNRFEAAKASGFIIRCLGN